MHRHEFNAVFRAIEDVSWSQRRQLIAQLRTVQAAEEAHRIVEERLQWLATCPTTDRWLALVDHGEARPHGLWPHALQSPRTQPANACLVRQGLQQMPACGFDRPLQSSEIGTVDVGSGSLCRALHSDHLPSCACTGHMRHDRADHSAALGHLLVVLRAQGAIAHPPVSTTPVDEELGRYDDHMDRVRGLAPQTRSMVLRIVGRLLAERFDGNAVDIKAITPEHVRRFFAEQAALHSKPAGAGSVVSSLRGYFRYRASLGDLVHGLIGALAYPANWALSSLPKKLTDEEVAQLVGSLNNPCRAMRRACAIVRCALDLGLRSIEVAQLSLDDIDWHAGTITLRHTKGRRVDILPLPVATGEAIARYLELERPKTSNRAIFVRNVAPRDAPVGADLIRITIRQAYARAGLPYTRSHLLRHTMANRLLASGSSLKEVADVLRHRSLNTTMIYAKLDSRSLAAVALPWPGSAS